MGLEEILIWLAYGVVGAIWKIFHKRGLENHQKNRLTAMLSGKLEWRSVSALSANIAADRQTTKTLLVQIGARQMKKPPYYWGLISRVGRA